MKLLYIIILISITTLCADKEIPVIDLQTQANFYRIHSQFLSIRNELNAKTSEYNSKSAERQKKIEELNSICGPKFILAENDKGLVCINMPTPPVVEKKEVK